MPPMGLVAHKIFLENAMRPSGGPAHQRKLTWLILDNGYYLKLKFLNWLGIYLFELFEYFSLTPKCLT